MKILASFLFVAAAGAVASANGFLLNEFDARAVGRGNATTATETDPSAIYYNVGGLAAGEGTNIMIGGSLIAPSTAFTYTDPSTGTTTKTSGNTSPQPVPGLFGSAHVTDMVAVGLGFYTPFGLANDWPATSPSANVAQTVSLRSYFITPAVGLNLGSFVPGLTVGAGIDLVPASIELQQQIFVGADGTGCGGTNPSCAHVGATAFGVGARFGVMYRPASAPRVSIGAMWRSNVAENFTGNVNFDAPAEYRQMLPADGPAKTNEFDLPQSISGGVGYRPVDNLEIEADLVWTQWSKHQSLDLTVPTPPGTTGTMVIASPERYSDTTTLRFGGEYTLPLVGAAVRAGFIYDPTPVPSTTLNATLPDVDRFDVTLGASKTFGRYGVHGGLLFVLPKSRSPSTTDPYTPEFKGTFDVSAWVASISLTAKLGE
jgi:long-chain fatty acid transport protein